MDIGTTQVILQLHQYPLLCLQIIAPIAQAQSTKPKKPAILCLTCAHVLVHVHMYLCLTCAHVLAEMHPCATSHLGSQGEIEPSLKTALDDT